ncbi:MAG: 3-oxoacyl-ACP synthase [Lachnospiraceae bacterium]|nr:3-oxoacyl-ACP synthase [Lachnospiraceae bacterium]
MKVYISDIEYVTGEKKKIECLICAEISEKKLQLFKKAGLEYYAECPEGIYYLGEKTAEKTLRYKENNIKEIMFTTGSFHNQPYPYNRIDEIRKLNKLLGNLKLDGFPYGIYLSDCSNLITAIKIGKNSLTDDPAKEILVITTDKVGESESRIVPPGSTIKSDGAASCILSSAPKGKCFEILEIKQFHNHKLIGDEDVTYENYAGEFTKCLDFVKNKIWLENSMNYKYVLVNNYSMNYVKSLSVQLKISLDLIYTDQISAHAHCFSSDLLINIFHLLKEGKLVHGDTLLGVTSGLSSISSISFRYVDNLAFSEQE